MELVRRFVCAFALVAAAPFVSAQDRESTREERTKDAFFSGNIVTLTQEKVTVTRRTLALTWVTRSFLLDAETRIEGTLKPKARVTVKFEKTEEGVRAVHIIVR